MEPAVRRPLALRPGHRLLKERRGFRGAAERAQRLADRVARDLDRLAVGRIPFASTQTPLERVQRRLVLAVLVALPAEVVEERAEPVPGVVVGLRQLYPAFRPAEEA